MNYFCHQCHQAVPLNTENFTCRICQEGFVEELTVSDDDEEREHIFEVHPDRNSGAHMTVVSGGMPNLQIVLRNIIESLVGDTNVATFGNFVGNRGDYAFFPEEFDNIVTSLLNRLDLNGPAPASQDDIANLEEKSPSQDIIDSDHQCSVCFDGYTANIKIRTLPCKHYFHTGCIVPWLERHGTCPICRKTLAGIDTSTGPTGAAYPYNDPSSSSSNTSPQF